MFCSSLLVKSLSDRGEGGCVLGSPVALNFFCCGVDIGCPSKMEVCLCIEMRQLMKEPNTRSRSDLPFSQMETANGKQCGVGRTRTNSRTLANVMSELLSQNQGVWKYVRSNRRASQRDARFQQYSQPLARWSSVIWDMYVYELFLLIKELLCFLRKLSSD